MRSAEIGNPLQSKGSFNPKHCVPFLFIWCSVRDKEVLMFPQRVYIDLRVSFSAEGIMTPLQIKWADGRVFEIDKVLDVRRAASEAGSTGLRYTVKIMGQTRLLFFEDAFSDTGKPRWFIEST